MALSGFDELNRVLKNKFENIPESTYLIIGTITGVNPLQIKNSNGIVEVQRISYAVAEREKTRGTQYDVSLKIGDSVLLLVNNQTETFLIEKMVRIK